MRVVCKDMSVLVTEHQSQNFKERPEMKYFMTSRYSGLADFYAHFIQSHQLKDKKTWGKFVKVFYDHADVSDEGWRGEYWGKMMRGACLTYLYTRDESLYFILQDTVKDILSVQDEYGRISAYDVEHEFRGWDIWGRKYVLTGLEHFYSICKNERLKGQILSGLKRQADYILERIGKGQNKTPIYETSSWWGGVNSCSILEPIVELYKLTDEKRYLDFAEYIFSTGGCSAGNLIDLVKEGKYPYTFPVTKAYEMMSFFEGMLAYYEVTKKEEYLATVVRFAEAVFESDITVIGCAGCTHELFDNAAEKQTEYSETIMQETCVTVTWMRLCARLWNNTHNSKYLDRIEISALNALYGSINENGCEMFSFEKNSYEQGLPFDSYSPLYNNCRGRGIGGFKEFTEGGFYGCCACIGAAGTAIYPLYAMINSEGSFYLNYFLNGRVEGETAQGKNVSFEVISEYPSDGHVKVKINIDEPESFGISLRIPDWCDDFQISVNGLTVKGDEKEYFKIFRQWKNGDVLEVLLKMKLQVTEKNGKTCFKYGPLVLARDEQKEKSQNLTEQFSYITKNGEPLYRLLPSQNREQIRLALKSENGEILLTDYASCGKNWREKENRITVWMNAKAIN